VPLKNTPVYEMLSEPHLSEPFRSNLLEFIDCFRQISGSKGLPDDFIESSIQELTQYILEQIESPYPFQSMHIPQQDDTRMYEIGLKIAAPLIHGTPEIVNLDNLFEVKSLLDRGGNVIFAANHQTELEPQILSLACDPYVKDLFKNTFFVAGERVTTDPMAAPFSRGRKLFCIYAKRYVSEDKNIEMERRMHNLKTIKQMKELLNKGGACIYVALGGGRDRPDLQGQVQLTPFDPSSVGLFTLLSQTALKPTHIFPLAVSSFNILPPPISIQKELGERRWTRGGSLKIAIGKRFDYSPFLKIGDKDEMHSALTNGLFSELTALYQPFEGDIAPSRAVH
jgi:glycerol-3-phosphate O-acyltransferase